MRVAILGTGAMGSRMAHRLIASGRYKVTVYNRTTERLRPLVDAGARAAATPADAAREQDVVVSMLRDDDASRHVWLDPQHGALAAMTGDAIVVDSSTVTPAWSRELAARCAERSLGCLDAPVLGSRPHAEAGNLIFLVGGDPTVLRRVEPVLDTLGAAVHHAGPAGTGAQLKLTANALFAIQVAAMAELLATLDDTGLTPERAVEILAATPVASPAAAAAAGAMVRRAYAPTFPIDLVTKDLRYATSTRHALPLTSAAATLYQRAEEEGHGADNITGIAQLYQDGARD